MESHLLQMRGLKPLTGILYEFKEQVASFTDAWIETSPESTEKKLEAVASFTDAWIETVMSRLRDAGLKSHLLQMRGLKRNTRNNPFILNGSHLLQMRGLKRDRNRIIAGTKSSHLLQMRGLKPKRRKKKISATSRIFYRCVD